MVLLLKPLIFLHDLSLALLTVMFHGEGLKASVDGVRTGMYTMWSSTRSTLIVPVFTCLVALCLIISFLVSIESVYMNLVILYVKLFDRKPEKVYKWEKMQEDMELGHQNYPVVLIQIPMYNEREVFELSIGAACRLMWPSDRLIVQVLDDSTDPDIMELINMECAKWASRDINIKYERRDNRNGYKAGALKHGMRHSYVKQCNYLVIFDADFQPEPDYLQRTIPFLIHNPELALVQARWKFEQQSGSTRHAFFGFNGTAGVWRIAAMEEAGGWKDRTTVEDMDLAVRVGLLGWKFVFINDVEVKSELPSQFKAFRFQQHRWSCGPANLFRKMTIEIIHNQRVKIWKKFYVIYSFFFLRKIIIHSFTFFFYCVILPTSVFVPEVKIPNWATIYVPSVITLLSAIATPRSFYLVIFWVLFENVMAMHRTKGTLIGLFEGGRVNEWVVTEKLGDTLATDLLPQLRKPRYGFLERVNSKEMVMGIYILCCACYDFFFGNAFLYLYLLMQSAAFLISGVGFVGT
ncbi:probable glucomannan 4-beta-mannosyltransferase 15 isoform X2 [Raphanus sativus]|uniref:Probable glucomannan 4-beta-mannosyltransferase 15 isoform X2 n=1 Tax=Raphanus sativus TaxID=3726 RepID=A0A6J0N1D7_RAPSA|nr:probable glucomannan 4-beta-mannosyltransferase 15 isoform X2 [Raphanus sativus]